MNISLGAIIQHIASSFCYFIIFLNYIFIECMFLLNFFYNLNHILEIFTLILTLYFITDCFVHINYHAIFLFFLSLSLGIFFFQFFFFWWLWWREWRGHIFSWLPWFFFYLTLSCMSLFRSSVYFDIMYMIYFFFLNIRIRAHFFWVFHILTSFK